MKLRTESIRKFSRETFPEYFHRLEFFVFQGHPEKKVPSLYLTLLDKFLLHKAVQLFLESQYPFHSWTSCCGKNLLCSDSAVHLFHLLPPSSCLQERVYIFPKTPNFTGSLISPLSLPWAKLVYLSNYTEVVSLFLFLFFNIFFLIFPHYTLR